MIRVWSRLPGDGAGPYSRDMTTVEPLLDPADTVRAFIAALEDRAVDQALLHVDDRIVWRNTSLPTVRGRVVKWLLRGLNRERFGFRADFHHVAADGAIVLTERTDYLRFGSFEIDFWVCGTFEVSDGRITLWHDHFSWGNVLFGVVRGIGRALYAAVV